MNYRLLAPAQTDLVSAVSYYEQAAPGLGLEFLDEFERAVQRILLQPAAWTRIAPNHRRCRLRRFPYGVIYSVEPDGILIAAVMDLRRHPDSWKSRHR